jgi:archaellum biogenesis protein FlaJ (TadC family)
MEKAEKDKAVKNLTTKLIINNSIATAVIVLAIFTIEHRQLRALAMALPIVEILIVGYFFKKTIQKINNS